MREIFNLSFSAPNLIPTIFLLVAVLYWLLVLVGFLDLSSGDLDLDKDISLDKDVNVDADANADGNGPEKEIHGNHSAGAWVATLKFFNLGEVPFMSFFSFLALFTWAISLSANYYLKNAGFLIGLALLIPAIIVAAFLTKFATWPLKGVFKVFNEEEKPFDFSGRICTVEVGPFGDKVGQATIEAEGKVLLVTVKSHDGTRFQPGQQAVVLDEAENDPGIYLIGPFQEGHT
jgi:hypothetical protein